MEKLTIHGLYGRFGISLQFFPDITILYGRNGSGKTTILHVLANILNASFDRFAFLEFDRIIATTSGGARLEIVQSSRNESLGDRLLILTNDTICEELSVPQLREEFARDKSDKTFADAATSRWKAIIESLNLGSAAYFPAFRPMIEAWYSAELDEYSRHYPVEAMDFMLDTQYEAALRRMAGRSRPAPLTSLARTLFGQFVPAISYPSPLRIERDLDEEVRRASIVVGRESQILLSNAFISAFAAVYKTEESEPELNTGELLQEIGNLLDEQEKTRLVKDVSRESSDIVTRLYDVMTPLAAGNLPGSASSVLKVYRDSLLQLLKVQQDTFSLIKKYIDAVNGFLEGKRITLLPPTGRTREARVRVELSDSSTIRIRSLSSGEREIVSMLYAASHISAAQAVLIDEPELSLHIDWQRQLLPNMVEQLGDRQVVVSTHSPMIGSEYMDKLVEIQPMPTMKPPTREELEMEEADIP